MAQPEASARFRELIHDSRPDPSLTPTGAIHGLTPGASWQIRVMSSESCDTVIRATPLEDVSGRGLEPRFPRIFEVGRAFVAKGDDVDEVAPVPGDFEERSRWSLYSEDSDRAVVRPSSHGPLGVAGRLHLFPSEPERDRVAAGQ